MRDMKDIEVGDGQVAVVLHRPRNSEPRLRGVVGNKDKLREFVDENFSRLERPHVSVRVENVRE